MTAHFDMSVNVGVFSNLGDVQLLISAFLSYHIG